MVGVLSAHWIVGAENAMPDTESPLPNQVVAACEQQVRAACPSGLDPKLVLDAMAPALALAQRLDWWPPVALPRVIGGALSRNDEDCVAVAVACILDYAASDIIDDVQDGNWSETKSANVQEAITIGTFLSYLAQRGFVALASVEQGGAIACAYSNYISAKLGGQHRDLRQRGPLPPALSEPDYLTTIAAKTGQALAWYASISARLWSNAADWHVLHDFGMAMGTAMQIVSDCHDLKESHSRDLANQQWTLPLIHAWRRLRRTPRETLRDAWFNARHHEVARLLGEADAWSYCDARMRVCIKEAELALTRAQGAWLPVAALNDYAHSLGHLQRRGLTLNHDLL